LTVNPRTGYILLGFIAFIIIYCYQAFGYLNDIGTVPDGTRKACQREPSPMAHLKEGCQIRMNIRKMTESDLMSLYGTISDPDVMKYIEEAYTLDKTRVIDHEIVLIPYYRNDEESFPWYQDPDVCKQVDNIDHVYDIDRLHAMYDFLSSNGNCYYIQYQGKLVGDVSLRNNAELAIVICKEYQNRHIGRRCILDMIELAKEKGMDKVKANIYSFNTQSQRMFQSVGFVETEEEWFEYSISEKRNNGPQTSFPRTVSVNGIEYEIEKLLGKGKGGYSYLAKRDGQEYVLKQIHHEPCSYYQFGNKIQSEINDYKRLSDIGIRMPVMIDVDIENERILKEYIPGDTIYDLVREEKMKTSYLEQIKAMCDLLYPANTNIDYFPTNFVVRGDEIFYIDYECNDYMEEWNFENWGVKYWSKTPEFIEYEKEHR
jgi:RimJ/RimL family protein N-acetyltransferase